MMMSTLVSSGAGVVTMTSIFAALGTAPVRAVIEKLLLELVALVDGACCCGAGIALLGSGVPVGGVFELVGMKTLVGASGSLVESI